MAVTHDGFHARDGWYFERGDAGTVTITNVKHPDCSITMDADSWASVVAAVCAGGETSSTFHRARALHLGEGMVLAGAQLAPLATAHTYTPQCAGHHPLNERCSS